MGMGEQNKRKQERLKRERDESARIWLTRDKKKRCAKKQAAG